MAVSTIVEGTNGRVYRNAIKPVGEAILLNFVREAVTLTGAGLNNSQNWYYDFEIDADYVVTGLEVTKTVASINTQDGIGDSQTLNVYVFRVGAGIDTAATATTIAQTSMTGFAETAGITQNTALGYSNTGQVGTRVFAGVPELSFTSGAAGAVILSSNTLVGTDAAVLNTDPTLVTNLFGGGVAADPLVSVAAVAPVAVGTTTKRRIRIAISTAKTTIVVARPLSCSCFIKVELARFSDVINSEELTSPVTTGAGTARVS
jgi:hypothetical protein